MPSRKRNKGKERKAKKEEAKRTLMQKTWRGRARGENNKNNISCDHGCMVIPSNNDHSVCKFMDDFFMRMVHQPCSNLKDLFQAHQLLCNNDSDRNLAANILITIAVNNLLSKDARNGNDVNDVGLAVNVAKAVVIFENYTGDLDETYFTRDVLKSNLLHRNGKRDILKFFCKRISCKCLKAIRSKARETLPKLGGCCHCSKVYERDFLYVCGRCRIPTYCSRECQIADSGLHRKECHNWIKHEECLVVKVKDGLPTKECSCNRCRAGLASSEEIGDDFVSDFFMRLHMVRGVRGTLCKIVAGKEVSLIVIYDSDTW